MSDEYFDDRSDHSIMDVSQYHEELTFLVSRHLHHNLGVMDPLLKSLGCRKVEYSGRQCYVQRPKAPPEGSEDLIRTTLLEALAHHAAGTNLDETVGFSILDGLATNQRWRICLHNENDAHLLAASLISFFARISDLISRDANHGSLGLVLLPGPLSILKSWTAPTASNQEYQEIPTLEDVICALFGNAWHQLVVDEPGVSQWDVPALVLALQPAFLPGLIMQGTKVARHPLPELE